MSAFAPTLRMEITDEKFRGYEAMGMSIDDVNDELTNLFSSISVADGARFTAESITVIETGQVLENFQAMIDAIFELDDVLHLKLATGDVVAVELYRV